MNISTKAVIDETLENSDGKPNLRTQDADNLALTKRYFSALNRVLLPYLITKGGPIVLYAIENEYNWFESAFAADKLSDYPTEGVPERPKNQTLDVRKYLSALRDFARADGIDIPITACPGDSTASFMGDTEDVIPMPNIYVGFNLEEHKYYTHLRKMHDPASYKGLYTNYPTGISETSVHVSHLRKAIMAGSDAVFLFNAIGFTQENFQNCILLNGKAFDITPASIWDTLRRLTDFSRLEYIRLGFVSPQIGYFPNVYDYFSAVGPSGTLREKYFNIRRINLFYAAFGEAIAEAGIPNRSAPGKEKMTPAEKMKFGLNFDITLRNGELGSDDPDLRSKVYYWLPLKSMSKTSALLGVLNPGNQKDVISVGTNFVTAFGTSFPKYTSLSVPVEQHSDPQDQVAHRAYMALLPINFQVLPGLKFRYSTSEILTTQDLGDRTLVVLTGRKGLRGETEVCFNITSESTPSSRLFHSFGNMGRSPASESTSSKNNNRMRILRKDSTIIVHARTFQPTEECVIFSYTHLAIPQNIVLEILDSPASFFHQPPPRIVQLVLLNHFHAGRTWFPTLGEGVGQVMMSGLDFVDDSQEPPVVEMSGSTDIYVYSANPFEFSLADSDEGLKLISAWDSFGMSVFQFTKPCYTESCGFKQIRLRSGRVWSERLPDPEKGIAMGDEPEHLEKHGVYTGHAWYSATVHLTSEEAARGGPLYIGHASDFVSIYINKHYIVTLGPMGTEIMNESEDYRYRWKIPGGVLQSGKNVFQFKVEIWGHGSFMFFRGFLKRVPFIGDSNLPLHFLNVSIPALGFDSLRGLFGKATFGDLPLSEWMLQPELEGDTNELWKLGVDTSNWNQWNFPVTMQAGATVWLKASFGIDDIPNFDNWKIPLQLNIKGRSAKARIYLNGHFICRWISDEVWIKKGTWVTPIRTLWTISDPDQCPIPSELLRNDADTPNEVTVLFEDASQVMDLQKPVPGIVTDFYLSLGSREPVKKDQHGNMMGQTMKLVPLSANAL